MPDKVCDMDIEIKVSTRSQQWCNIYNYRKLGARKNKKKGEYSVNTKDMQWDFEDKCIIKFRAVKFMINDPDSDKEVWEVLITNLPREKFPVDVMKKIYHMRWGIETSFKELKYALGAINFHSKKDEYILQELYAHLVAYNAVARIAAQIPVEHNSKGYAYAVDFKMVVHIFRIYYRKRQKAPPDDMLADMSGYRHLIKDGRHNIRVLKPKSAIWFTYRVA